MSWAYVQENSQLGLSDKPDSVLATCALMLAVNKLGPIGSVVFY
ncbi:hypothetical protein yaldo0001_37680, partial [Yersinia aldovae ATCC 35236]